MLQNKHKKLLLAFLTKLIILERISKVLLQDRPYLMLSDWVSRQQ